MTMIATSAIILTTRKTICRAAAWAAPLTMMTSLAMRTAPAATVHWARMRPARKGYGAVWVVAIMRARKVMRRWH